MRDTATSVSGEPDTSMAPDVLQAAIEADRSPATNQPPQLRDVDASEWDRILDDQPGATPFHESSLLTSTADELGRDLRLVAVSVDGVDVGGLPLLSRQWGPVGSVNLLPGVPGLGPVMAARWQAQAMDGARRLAPGWTILERFETEADVRPELGPHWRALPDDSYVIDLDGLDEDELLAEMTVNTRRLIRRAARETGTGEATDAEIAELLPRWEAATFGRSGTRLHFGSGTVRRMADAMSVRCPVYRGALRLDGQPICLFVVCARGTRAFGWHLVSDLEHRKLGAGFGGYWEMMRWAKARGCSSIDFGGGPTPGIERAKLSLGATERPVYRYERGWLPARAAREAQVRWQARRRLSNYRARQSH